MDSKPGGHRGVVFRPWTATDIQQAASHLPDIKNGAAFGKEFLAFCKEFMPTGPEIHRLLVKHVGLSDFSKIRAVVTGQGCDSRHEAPDWDHADNVAYRAFVTAVCAAVVTAFPATVNMAPINSTKQGRTEDVTFYHQRLVAAFQIHSGLEEPTDITNMTVWETHLKNAFMNGLLPDVKTATEHSVVGLEDARLTEVVKHARHNYKMHVENQMRQDKRSKQTGEKAQLAMLQALKQLTLGAEGGRDPHPSGNFYGRDQQRGRAYGINHGRRRRFQGGAPREVQPDECFLWRNRTLVPRLPLPFKPGTSATWSTAPLRD
uniref:uncharacterized protein LOC120829098 n=1 Tax=Gasterosteus aculeatus aculeatus TaxID=481459 RepID=UPI001A99C9CC|nr:uncharacterized protein LOC120829098 [Gasterosteus aculeatus aculeatus]XP_040048874.1 uncharacterized protein LOC120829098 [Gasterosteus aculeatus aculeatus]